MKNKDNMRKEQMEGAWEAMSQIIIQQEDMRQLDTIRVRVIERSNWRQGWRRVCGMWTEGSGECFGSVWKHAKMYEGAGIKLLRLGSNISAWIMSAKMKWVLWNVTILRDQAEEFPLCQQLYSYQGQSPKVRNARPKLGSKVGDWNVDRGNQEAQVKIDNKNIQESVRENEK